MKNRIAFRATPDYIQQQYVQDTFWSADCRSIWRWICSRDLFIVRSPRRFTHRMAQEPVHDLVRLHEVRVQRERAYRARAKSVLPDGAGMQAMGTTIDCTLRLGQACSRPTTPAGNFGIKSEMSGDSGARRGTEWTQAVSLPLADRPRRQARQTSLTEAVRPIRAGDRTTNHIVSVLDHQPLRSRASLRSSAWPTWRWRSRFRLCFQYALASIYSARTANVVSAVVPGSTGGCRRPAPCRNFWIRT
jgi:hypothetical protein